VEPKRIEVIEVASTMTLAQLAKRHPSSVDNATLALINGVAENATFETGTLVKLVVGGALPED
jgi:predicted Zn-dependent protease